MSRYTRSADFTALHEQTRELAADLAAIVHSVLIDGPRVDVRLYEGEPDYSAEVLATFDRFKHGAAQTYKFEFGESADVNHIEGQIRDRVGLLYQDTFVKLGEYSAANKEFRDPTIVGFDREIQFYIAYLDHVAGFKKVGLNFCYPRVTEARGEIFDYQGFDLALAGKLLGEGAPPVCNDLHLKGPERIIVVSGPNQGGKTTFARTFGQLHYLASLGCPIPGTQAQLILFNEPFAATNEREGSEIAHNIMTALLDKRIRMVCVTHLSELAHRFYERNIGNALFLRAERARTFKLREGEPLPTSFGEDLYNSIFAADVEHTQPESTKLRVTTK